MRVLRRDIKIVFFGAQFYFNQYLNEVDPFQNQQ